MLASQTAKATDDIRNRIQKLQSQIDQLTLRLSETQQKAEASARIASHASDQLALISQETDEADTLVREISGILEQQTEAVAMMAKEIQTAAACANNAAGDTSHVIQHISGCERLIEENFARLEARGAPNYVLHRAKSDHVLWKKRLSEMRVGLNSLKASELSSHHHCRLGKWYDAVSDDAVKSHPDFVSLLDPHARVHRHGVAAAKAHEAGDRLQVDKELEEMERASVEVLAKLDSLLTAA
jgi:methyl-accepting chemotaxis protein